MSQFVHLHTHTEYSLLDGLSKINALIEQAKAFGMDTLAVTDHGVMFGAIEFYSACKAAEIKPVIGMEAYVSKEDHKVKERTAGKYRDNNHLVLLAKNLEGYQNLMELTSIAHIEGFYYKPRFDKPTLAKYAKGLVCLSACMAGEIAEYIQIDEYDLARKTALWYAQTFGQDNYYLEIQRHNYNKYTATALNDRIKADLNEMQTREDKINQGIISLSKDLGLPLVATNDVHYIKPEHAAAQDALVCIQTGKQVADTNRLRYADTPTFYLRSPQEMAELFSDQPSALSNTVKIAKACNLEIKLGEWYFPKFDIPDNKTAGEYLKEIAYQGAERIYGGIPQTVADRLDFELDVIEQRGYSPYFLIVGEMVNWCRSQGIVTTTRGSAAGCLVLFVTGITEVDPLKYKLPFERFLNPFRPSPPDIDLDIADNRRNDLIHHLSEKYGVDKVAQICTFGRMMARASVRDIGRVLGYPYSFPDKISKAIPMGSQGFKMSIDKALKVAPELKKYYNENADAKKIIDLAKQIEGNARHSSVHAAGVVVAPDRMVKLSPIQKESGGDKIITQYEMHAAENVGLIKFDILGIRNLAILNSAVDIVADKLGIKVDIKSVPLNDKSTFEMLARGETMGTFQLGGTGMTKYLMDLKPERVDDLMAMVALYRPGPMANIPEYIKRKNNPKLVKFMHPKMEKFLDVSYGLLVYQEDILFTAIELAGYDWGTVDKLRKAIGKKIPEEMKRQEQIFIEGCLTHSGLAEPEARKIWDLFVPFQGYGFNKAHAAAYGIVAYQTAYMKAHYPVEYMTAVLTAESEYTDKIVLAINECNRMGIPVLPPDINTSETNFTIIPMENSKYKKAIRFGFSAVKNVGNAAIDSIITARNPVGEFKSFTHFFKLVDTRKVNKKVVESLIKVGGMDAFGKRAAMLAAIDDLRTTASKKSAGDLAGQSGLFDDNATQIPVDKLPDIPEFPQAELLGFEKQLLGLYLTKHPMAELLAQMAEQVTYNIADLDPQLHKGLSVTLGGIPTKIRTTMTKTKNQEMAFVTLEDTTGHIDVVIFPRTWETVKTMIQEDSPILISGKLDLKEDMLNLLASSARRPSIQAVAQNGGQSDYNHVLVIERGTPKTVLQQIGQILKNSPGKETVAVKLTNGEQSIKLMVLPYTVSFTPEINQQIQQLLQT